MADITQHDSGDRYDANDIRLLTKLVRDGCTWAYIADRLGRTAAGVRAKWYRLRKAGKA